MNQWNGLHTSYDASYDALYVFVLSRTKVNTNANSIDNGYFRIVAKFLDIKYFVSYLSRNNDKNITASTSDIIYSPETYGNISISETQSLSIGVTASGEVSNDGGQLGVSISFGASNSNTVNKSCALLKPNSMPLNEFGNELGKNDGYNIYGRKVELRFDWQNTYKNNLNGKSHIEEISLSIQ